MQTIYSIDYLKSIPKEKLLELAKKNSEFNMAFMERKLKIPKNTLRFAIERSASKYDKKIKKYLIDFLSTGADLDLNLKELFKEANKYQKITNKKIAEDLGCDVTTVSASKMGKTKGKNAYLIKEYLENIINKYEPRKEQEQMSNELNLEELFNKVNNFQKLTKKQIADDLNCAQSAVVNSINGNSKGRIAHLVKEYLGNIIIEQEQLHGAEFSKEFNLDALFKEANKYQKVTKKKIAEDLICKADTVTSSISGQSRGETAYRIKEYLENIINQYKPLDEALQQDSTQAKEQETMTEETFTEDKEMKTYDNFLNFIDTQKELPIVKKALEETLKENQNLDKILAKEEFITIETALELNEKLFANEYTEEEILDFENQYFGTTGNAPLKDKIKSFVEKHNLSLETALKLLQISEEDYKKMLEGSDKVSNKTADKIYKAISAFDEFYHSEKTQDTINNTKNTFVTGFAIASAKSQTFLNKGLNKFADFLNKSADKIKNSNSENKED